MEGINESANFPNPVPEKNVATHNHRTRFQLRQEKLAAEEKVLKKRRLEVTPSEPVIKSEVDVDIGYTEPNDILEVDPVVDQAIVECGEVFVSSMKQEVSTDIKKEAEPVAATQFPNKAIQTAVIKLFPTANRDDLKLLLSSKPKNNQTISSLNTSLCVPNIQSPLPVSKLPIEPCAVPPCNSSEIKTRNIPEFSGNAQKMCVPENHAKPKHDREQSSAKLPEEEISVPTTKLLKQSETIGSENSSRGTPDVSLTFFMLGLLLDGFNAKHLESMEAKMTITEEDRTTHISDKATPSTSRAKSKLKQPKAIKANNFTEVFHVIPVMNCLLKFFRLKELLQYRLVCSKWKVAINAALERQFLQAVTFRGSTSEVPTSPVLPFLLYQLKKRYTFAAGFSPFWKLARYGTPPWTGRCATFDMTKEKWTHFEKFNSQELYSDTEQFYSTYSEYVTTMKSRATRFWIENVNPFLSKYGRELAHITLRQDDCALSPKGLYEILADLLPHLNNLETLEIQVGFRKITVKPNELWENTGHSVSNQATLKRRRQADLDNTVISRMLGWTRELEDAEDEGWKLKKLKAVKISMTDTFLLHDKMYSGGLSNVENEYLEHVPFQVIWNSCPVLKSIWIEYHFKEEIMVAMDTRAVKKEKGLQSSSKCNEKAGYFRKTISKCQKAGIMTRANWANNTFALRIMQES